MRSIVRSVFFVFLAGLVFLSPLLGFCQDEREQIRGALRGYLGALKSGDASTAYTMLCESDRKRRSDREFFKKSLLGEKYYLLRIMSFSISSVALEGDRAVADYTISFPDLNEFAEKMGADPDIIPLMLTAMITGNQAIFKEAAGLTQKMVAQCETIEVAKKVELVKEGGKWKVHENFAKQDYAGSVVVKVAEVTKSPASAEVQVTNNGKRRIKDVEVAIYMLDSKGVRIKEGRCNSPEGVILKGGQTGSYACTLRGSVPAKWAGKVEYEFKDFKFGIEE